MKRRTANTKQRTLLWILSLVIVGSMVCSLLISLLPTPTEPAPTATPAIVMPTATPGA